MDFYELRGFSICLKFKKNVAEQNKVNLIIWKPLKSDKINVCMIIKL